MEESAPTTVIAYSLDQIANILIDRVSPIFAGGFSYLNYQKESIELGETLFFHTERNCIRSYVDSDVRKRMWQWCPLIACSKKFYITIRENIC